MGSKERPTMLDRLLEMVRGRGKARPELGSRKADQVQSRKEGKKRKRAASAT
ncbi:MAG: hypothetical protein ABSC55_29535 [Syntrophorhabdales bacterium]